MQMKKEDYFICATLSYFFYWAGGHYWYTNEKDKAWNNITIGLLIAPCTFGISTIVMQIIGVVKAIQFLVAGIKLIQAEDERKKQQESQTQQFNQQYQQNYNQQQPYQTYQQYQSPYQQSYYQAYQPHNENEKKDS